MDNPWTKPIYVRSRGDHYEFLFNNKGALVEIRCCTGGRGRVEVLEYNEVPSDVLHDYQNQYIHRNVKPS